MGFLRRWFRGGKPRDIEALDAATIEAVRQAGARLENPRETLHCLYFAHEADARTAGASLERDGRTIEIRPAAIGGKWLVLVTQEMIVSPASIATARQEFERASAVPGAEYDGWEAAVPEAAGRPG
jgi:Regulator of ribonuclease activity B